MAKNDDVAKPVDSQCDRLVFRYRENDGVDHVSRDTVREAARTLDVSETDLIHLALARFIRAGGHKIAHGDITSDEYSSLTERANKFGGIAGKAVGVALVE